MNPIQYFSLSLSLSLSVCVCLSMAQRLIKWLNIKQYTKALALYNIRRMTPALTLRGLKLNVNNGTFMGEKGWDRLRYKVSIEEGKWCEKNIMTLRCLVYMKKFKREKMLRKNLSQFFSPNEINYKYLVYYHNFWK